MFKRKKGFTIVELLIILAIIAVVAAITVPLVMGVQGQASNSDLNNTLTQVELAIEQFKTNGSKTATGFNRLSNEDDGLFISEQQLFLENAGKGLLPGGQVQSTDLTDSTAVLSDVVYSLMRKEAITAVKAFTDIPVIDNVETPQNNYYLDLDIEEGKAVVYNYLTGAITLENVSDVISRTAVDASGAVDINAYYVFLTKPAGNGETQPGPGGGETPPDIPEDDEEFVGDFYLRVVDWITKEPLQDVFVELYNGIEYREYKTNSAGYLILNDTFRYGEYVLTLSKPGYVTYFDDVIYPAQHPNAEIVVTKDGYLGDSSLNLYNVELINVTQGDMSFTKKTAVFNKVSEKWEYTTHDLKSGILTVTFEPDTSDLSEAKSERKESYTVDLSKTNGKVDLLTEVDGVVKKLTFGNYIMTVDLETEPKIRTLVKKVTVNEYGIDERVESERKHKGVREFYTYVQELKTLKTELKGNISSVMDLAYQPLKTDAYTIDGTAVTYWNFENANKKGITTYVELWKDGVCKYKQEIEDNGDYQIIGIDDGTYDVYVNNTYCSKFQPSKIAYKLKAEGYDSTLDMIVAESDYPEANVTFTLKFPDGSPITTGFEVRKLGVKGLTNPVKTGELTDGQAKFKLKTGIYKFRYTKPYAKTEDDFFTYVLVTDKGVTINALYTQVNTKININHITPTGLNTLPNDTKAQVRFTCTDRGNVASPVTINIGTDGKGTVLLKPGNYKVEFIYGKHYKEFTTTTAAFSKKQSWLVQHSTGISMSTSYSTVLTEHTLVYESVANNTHLQHCLLCDYKTPAVACTFNGTRELPTDTNAKTHHYTYCSVCKINKELQVHVFEGEYKKVGTITGANTGTHYRKCTTCTAYGLNGTKDKTESCSLYVKSIASTTHKFECSKCKNTADITHNYTGDYVVKVQSTKDKAGTHARKCLDCDSTGIGNTKDKTTTCTMVTKSTTTGQHTMICNVCNKNTYSGNHEFGDYLSVKAKTATFVGQHNRQCWICKFYEATANCGAVLDETVYKTATHRYKCDKCTNYYDFNHTFTGAYKVVTAGETGTHQRKCTACNKYGIGSGTSAKMNGTEVCTFGTPVKTTATQHKATCTLCKLNTYTEAHNWGEWYSVEDQTETTYGKHERECEDCGHTEQKSCNKNKCTSVNLGYHEYECTLCGNSVQTVHDFTGAYNTIQELNWSTEQCVHKYKCDDCGKYGYNGNMSDVYMDVDKTVTDTYIKLTCNVCGKTLTNYKPTVTVTRNPSGDTIAPNASTKKATAKVTATASDSDGSIAEYSWYIIHQTPTGVQTGPTLIEKGTKNSLNYTFDLGFNMILVQVKDNNGATAIATTSFMVMDSTSGGGMTLTGAESVIPNEAPLGARISYIYFEVPDVSGHSGSDYLKIMGYDRNTKTWVELAYISTRNGATGIVTDDGTGGTNTSIKLSDYDISKITMTYYTNHDCMYGKSEIKYSVKYDFSGVDIDLGELA